TFKYVRRAAPTAASADVISTD
ncbi:MAG: hypothetical protein JWQ13_9, partial [Ramlibacter sp.]|nr:hypothetical protein [Ramlibacter sp.]